MNEMRFGASSERGYVLHLPMAHLDIYQKGVYYLGIKIFNSLQWDIKTYIDNPRTYKKAVKKFLNTNSFYSLNEYFDNNNIKFWLVNISHHHSIVLTPNNFQYPAPILYYCFTVLYFIVFVCILHHVWYS
jgi:hypothetical protein